MADCVYPVMRFIHCWRKKAVEQYAQPEFLKLSQRSIMRRSSRLLLVLSQCFAIALDTTFRMETTGILDSHYNVY